MTESLETGERVDAPKAPRNVFGSIAAYSLLVMGMILTPLYVFLPAALFHCAYRNGRRAAWLALLFGGAVGGYVMISALRSADPAFLNAGRTQLIVFILGLALPALAVTPLVLRNEPFGKVLSIGLLLGMVGLFATEGLMRRAFHYSPYEAQMSKVKQEAPKLIEDSAKGYPSGPKTFLTRMLDAGIYCLPSLHIMDIALFFALSLVMYGRMRAWREFMATREVTTNGPYLFRNLVLPEWLIFGFIIGGVFPMETGMLKWISANVLAVVGFLYFLQGLAIFRSMLVSVGAGLLGALFAYAAVLLAALISFPVLSLTGLFDSFFDYRHFNRKDSSHEGHSD